MPMQTQITFGWFLRSGCVLFVFWTALSIVSPAATGAQAPAHKSSPEEKAKEQTDQTGTPNRAQRQRLVMVAVLMLAGVASVGLALLVFVILWGFRIRRMMRTPPPKQSPLDELWYLRPKKRIPSADSNDQTDAEPKKDETESA